MIVRHVSLWGPLGGFKQVPTRLQWPRASVGLRHCGSYVGRRTMMVGDCRPRTAHELPSLCLQKHDLRDD